jgi:four helix bundle protein
MYIYSFEKLDVWKKARKLNSQIYTITKKFPKEETYGLVQQLRRASISISSNLAEGSSRNTYRDKARFTNIAYSSLMEVLNQLILSKDLKYINENEYLEIRPLVEEIGNKLNALLNYQLKNTN